MACNSMECHYIKNVIFVMSSLYGVLQWYWCQSVRWNINQLNLHFTGLVGVYKKWECSLFKIKYKHSSWDPIPGALQSMPVHSVFFFKLFLDPSLILEEEDQWAHIFYATTI